MKAYNYIVYALWVILAIVAKILGASWWVALSPIWFPVGVIFVILLGLKISVDVGKILKRKKAKADPDSCENCLFSANLREKASLSPLSWKRRLSFLTHSRRSSWLAIMSMESSDVGS